MDELSEETEIAKSPPGLYVSGERGEGNCDCPPLLPPVHFRLPSPTPSPVSSAQIPVPPHPGASCSSDSVLGPPHPWSPQLGMATLPGPRRLKVLSCRGSGGAAPASSRPLPGHLEETSGRSPWPSLFLFPVHVVTCIVRPCPFLLFFLYLYLSKNLFLHCYFRVVS